LLSNRTLLIISSFIVFKTCCSELPIKSRYRGIFFLFCLSSSRLNLKRFVVLHRSSFLLKRWQFLNRRRLIFIHIIRSSKSIYFRNLTKTVIVISFTEKWDIWISTFMTLFLEMLNIIVLPIYKISSITSRCHCGFFNLNPRFFSRFRSCSISIRYKIIFIHGRVSSTNLFLSSKFSTMNFSINSRNLS